MDLNSFNLWFVCPCEKVLGLVNSKRGKPAVCPHCGRGSAEFRMRSLRWVSESKFFSPKTWNRGYWVESKIPLKLEQQSTRGSPMTALLDGIMGGMDGDSPR